MQSLSPHVDTCADEEMGEPLVLDMMGTYVLNTDRDKERLISPTLEAVPMTSSRLLQDDGTEILLVRTKELSIAPGATLRAVGTSPLVIVSREAIQLRGTIDVSSANDGACMPTRPGAGANPIACESFHLNSDGTADGSGGGGGGFGSTGGDGGGDDGSGVGGDSEADVSRIRGGCRGGFAGLAGDKIDGGSGGGAVGLISLETIQIYENARLLAGGAGGLAGVVAPEPSSGSGGGSGGMIDLSAQAVRVRAGAQILANGGGGGGGVGINGADDDHAAGLCGANAMQISTISPAAGGPGGSASSSGANGGNGAGFGIDATAGGTASGSGHGGGGGGVGYVRVHADNLDDQGLISPGAENVGF